MPRKTDRLPGILHTDPAAKAYYHTQFKGKAKCGNQLGRLIQGGKDNISAKEAKVFAEHYQRDVVERRESAISARAVVAMNRKDSKDTLGKLMYENGVRGELSKIFPAFPMITKLVFEYLATSISQPHEPKEYGSIFANRTLARLFLEFLCETKSDVEQVARHFKPVRWVSAEAIRSIYVREQIEQLALHMKTATAKALKQRVAHIEQLIEDNEKIFPPGEAPQYALTVVAKVKATLNKKKKCVEG